MALAALIAAFALPIHAAPVVFGSWQDNDGDGWTDNSDASITNAVNMPSKYEFLSGVVSGFPKSLAVHETGYGNNRLKINVTTLDPAVLAAFTNGTKMQFTFSCPPDTGAGSGYMQIAEIQVNSPGSGFFQAATTGSDNFTTNGFTSTGDTGNNLAGGTPNYYFYASAPARKQVVTWDYSSKKSNILSSAISYLQITFVFNAGGGAPTNVLMNDVKFLGADAPPAATTNLVVDDFVPAGVSPSNPANYDYYQSAQNYSSGQITNVYGNWFGGAFESLSWDSASDASNNPASGSLKINVNWTNGNQFVVWNQGSPNNFFALNVNANTFTNFECDVRFSPDSAVATSGSLTNIFGHLRFGNRTAGYSQEWFGAVDVVATNTNWVHVSIPLNTTSFPSLTNINGLLFNIDRNFYSLNLSTHSTLWVDNIKFVGPVAAPVVAAPTLAVEKANPRLRIFAGSSVNTYDRASIATVDVNQSWIGGTFPVTYSFTLTSVPALEGWQTHLFLIPTHATTPGNGVFNNQFVDYQASNSVWLQINSSSNGNCTANVSWKANNPNANPNNVAVNITNSTPVGTWAVTFNSASTGTLTAPGASPVAFTITDPDVATRFANPLVAIFGIQPQSSAYYGRYVEYSAISVSGVAGTPTSDNFTTATSLGSNWDVTDSAYTNSIVQVPPGSAYWVNWSLPDAGYGLEVAPTLTDTTYKVPEFYNAYNDGLVLPVTRQEGARRWALVPTNCLPTVDTTQGGTPSANGFFRLSNNPNAP